MKRTLLLAALLVTFGAKGQMTLEHTYHPTNSFSTVMLEGEGDKYIFWDTSSKNIKLYNPDHSLWKTINFNVPSGNTFGAFTAVSTKFFNLDRKVEVFFSTHTISTPYTYTGYLINEDGSILQTLPNIYYVFPIKVANTWKAQGYDVSNGWNNHIYSVPGSMPTPTGLKPAEMRASNTTLYPNPVDNAATLLYSLPEGVQTGTLRVFDVNGRVVRSYEVSNRFNDILIQRNELTPGIYTYQLSSEGTITATEQFVVR